MSRSVADAKRSSNGKPKTMTRSLRPTRPRILLLVVSCLALSVASCDDDSPTLPSASGLTVVSTTPADNATDVGPDTDLVVVFSDPIQPATFDGGTVDVMGGTVPLAAGATSVAGNTATFVPDPAFERGAAYQITLTTGITSTDGETLDSPFTWTFNTQAPPDTIPPQVTSVDPVDSATDAPIDAPIVVRFGEPIAPATVNAATLVLIGGSQPIDTGTVSVSDGTITFVPNPSLDPLTTYTATVGTAITDLAGNPLEEPYVWNFTTAGP